MEKNKNIKLLFVTHKYPPGIGGMENHCFELYNGISPSIDTVMLKLPDNASRVWWLLTLSKRVKRALESDKGITHVYFNDGLTGMCCRSIKKYSNVKTVVTFHGLDAVYPNKIYQNALCDNLKNSIDAVIAVSTATASECIKRGAPPSKVHVVPNGVAPSLKKVKPDKKFLPKLEKNLGVNLKGKKILVSTGRSIKRKGFSWFLDNVLPELGNEIIYIMVGPRDKGLGKKLFFMNLLPKRVSRQIWLTGIGIDQANIDKSLAKPLLSGRAFHLGSIPAAELEQVLRISYAFIMPNIHIEGDAEGFGLVALEAAMNGTVVLASNIEGITEAVHDGKNGILVEAENIDAWVGAVNKICASPALRERIAYKAASYTEKRFSWAKMADGYLKIIRKL
ncbi:MAG: glycosyltransferase family 4 protein [Leptospirales bacterium]|nr:glycosyltransferase family 4 protein [Leptospirales bacterium]